jgi:pantoate kinase
METQISFEDIKKRLENIVDEPVEVMEDMRSQLVAPMPTEIVEINPDEAVPVECSTIITPDTHSPLTQEEIEEIRKSGLEKVAELRKNETEYEKLKRKSEYAKVVTLYDMNEPVYSNVREMEGLTKLKFVEKVTEYFEKDIDFLEERFNRIMKAVLIDGDVSAIPF